MFDTRELCNNFEHGLDATGGPYLASFGCPELPTASHVMIDPLSNALSFQLPRVLISLSAPTDQGGFNLGRSERIGRGI